MKVLVVDDERNIVDPRTLDVHVRSLRRKLEADPSQPKHLRTVRGVGFRFAV